MKKIICVCIFILCCSLVFAVGSNESQVGGVTTDQSNNTSQLGIINQLISSIGSAFTDLTTSVMLGLHPFPNILLQFYETKDGKIVDASVDYSMSTSLISNEYYDLSGWATTDDGFVQLTGAEGEGKGFYISEDTSKKNSPKQQTRWSIISYLFVVFFAAEIIFTAIFGYIAPQDENASLFRQIGVSAAMTIMLFLLCAALPFLLEAVRYGLFNIAKEFVGQNNNFPETMFGLPAKFMTDMAKLMQNVFWGNDIQDVMSGSTTLASVKLGILGSLLCGIMFIIFEFVLCMTIIKAGLHIVVNLVEIYILLSVVMLTLPMSVFTPLKSVLRKGVYSLLNNLLECFILCLMVLIVIPACQNALSGVIKLQEIYSNYAERNINLALNGTVTLQDGTTTTEIFWSLVPQAVSDTEYYIVLQWQGTTDLLNDKKGYVAYKDLSEGFLSVLKNSTYPENQYYYIDFKNVDGAENISQDASPEMYGGVVSTNYTDLNEFLKAYAAQTIKRFKSIAYEQYMRYSGFNSLIPKDKTDSSYKRQANMYLDSYQNLFVGIHSTKHVETYVYFNENATNEIETSAGNLRMIAGLVICWLVVYLPCYFVQQSTQIVNALSSGNAGPESLSNALSQDMRGVQQGLTVAANVAKSAVSSVAQFATGGMTGNLAGMAGALRQASDKNKDE